MGIRLAVVLAVCAPFTLALAATAPAASSNGAQVDIVHQCDTSEFGTFCIDTHVVSNLISSPSGTEVLVAETRFDSSFVADPAAGACSFEQSGQDHFYAVFGPQANVSGDLMRQEFRFPAACTAGDIIVCETVLHFHQVNGVLQFQRSTAECSEEPAP